MIFSRRKFLLASFGLMAAGCASEQVVSGDRPGPSWPQAVLRPTPAGDPPPVKVLRPIPALTKVQAVSPAVNLLHAIPRTQWASADPMKDRLNPLGKITDLTIHHEGWTPVWFTDVRTTADRIDLIRRSHIQRLHAGDIGYHFIVDRGGRVWEGRPLNYQGAHVKEHNPNNVGIMCLGNFDVQQPTDAQLQTLRDTIQKLMQQYKVPVKRVHTHKELNPTACPGRNLQPVMVRMRRGKLA